MPDDSALSAQKRRLVEELLSGRAAGAASDRIESRNPSDPVPLSAEQTGVWLHAAMGQGPLYNESFTVHRYGAFSREAMQETLDQLLQRHEIWRTAFEEHDGEVRAVVDPAARVKLDFVDFADLPADRREAAALELGTKEAQRPFELARAPLMRVTAVRLAPDQHRLYFSLHHIVFDGVSIYRVLMPELAAIYAALAVGETPKIPPPTLQYADYAVWQTRRAVKAEQARGLDYWRRQLADLPADLKLPIDRLPPESRSHQGDMLTFELAPGLNGELKHMAQSFGVTFYALLLASFKALLHGYSGQEDFVIGGVVDTRSRPELERTIGYFLNGVALRSHPIGTKAFSAYMVEVQQTVVEAMDAAAVPFERVVRVVRPHRQGSVHPLYQVLFSIQPPNDHWPEGWDLTQMDVPTGSAKFDLYLELDERAGCVIGRFLYDRELFDRSTIARMASHWRTLLAAVMEDPHTTLAELAAPLPTELPDGNDLDRGIDLAIPPVTLNGWFREQALANPGAIAIEAGPIRWTYRALRLRAMEFAACLRRMDVARESVIGVAMERTPDMVAALLGILEAGCCYLPLDPDLPAARLALLIDDAKPAAVLSQDSVAGRLPAKDVPVIRAEEIDGEVSYDKPSTASPDNLAYILYTSGSTGRPKAVEIEHRSVVNLLMAIQRETGFHAKDRLLAVTTISFDIAALELFLPLVTGGRLILAARTQIADPKVLATLLYDCRATMMQATPALWRALIQSGWAGQGRLKALCGGDVLPPALAQELRKRVFTLWNVYGPTETTIWSTIHEVEGGDDPVPIGKPLANTTLHVVDAAGAPAPVGVAGELLIGGAGLARGYRGAGDLTARRFVSLPGLSPGRLYRTGDRVRRGPDGNLLFLGRIDNQTKIRGFRVGLEEVEQALAAHPLVVAVAVKAVPDASQERSLVAFVVPLKPAADLAAALTASLREQLPSYMVPGRVIEVAALPLTVSGKIDRTRLPDPPAEAESEAAPMADEIEQALMALWQDLLRLPAIGLDDNFFDLGGHSLLAYTMLARLRSMAISEPTMAAFFAAPTIRRLASLVRQARRPAFSHLVPLRPGTGNALFIVHGVFGNVLELAPLAMRLKTERPVVAIQARGADPSLEPHPTLDAMVEAYIDAIRAAQPDGPYYLAGYSLGGLVAFEMACRLRAAGDAVPLVALLDTDLPFRLLPLLDKLNYVQALARRVLRKLRTTSPSHWLGYLTAKVKQLRRTLGPPPVEGFVPPMEDLPEDLRHRHRHMYDIGLRVFYTFAPSHFDGRLQYFMTAGPRYHSCDPRPIWRRAARSLEVIEVPGEHNTIMRGRNVPMLAAELSARLAAACREA